MAPTSTLNDHCIDREPKEEPVLVAVDFSPNSETALLWACEHATRMNSPLVILHVIHEPAHTPGFYQRKLADCDRSLEDLAQLWMDEFLEKVRAEHPDNKALFEARVKFVTGLPPGRISEVGEEENAQLIVVGTSGLSGIQSILKGSVPECVVEISPGPVVIVKRP